MTDKPPGLILLAHGNADMRDYLKHLLGGRYQVDAVSDGESALRAARARTPDLALSDVMIPGVDGLSLLRSLRADPSTSKVPIILLCDRAGEEAQAQALEAGADDYLVKPFSSRELLARVAGCLRRARERQDAADELSASLSELKRANGELRDARRASLNLLEDAVEARDRAEQLNRDLQEHEAWLRGQQEALTAAVAGAPLPDSLAPLVRTVSEALGPNVKAAFYLANKDRTTLHHVVGMSTEYAQAVDGFLIGPESLACGLSTHTGEPVVTPDVQSDSRWEPWRWLAQQFGYRSCWSFPVLTAAGKFVGTMAVYSPEPRTASARDLELASVLTNTAAIIVARHVEWEVRKQAEQALHESEIRARRLVEGIAQATWEMDGSGLAVSDSPSWREYTGQTLEEWLGAGWLDAVHPDDRAYAESQWREGVAAQRAVDAEFRLRHAPDGYRWTNVRAEPLLSAEGAVQKWVGMNIDIDARKRAEAALRSAEEKYRTLSASITVEATR